MGSSMPEIGSKISLISKADIRYEGKLFTVDPNECTIALSHVRSFGTEDRCPHYPVPAQTQVYEYILFRGSDIKDISIINPQQLPNDPAIVSGMAPSMSSGHSYTYNHSGVMPTPAPAPTQQYSGYMAPGMGRSLGKQGMSSELLNVNPPEPIPVIPIVKEPTSELIAGSRSSTPSLARKSPTIDQAVQVSPHKDKKVIQPPVPREGRQNRNEQNRNQSELYQRRDYRGQGQGDGSRENEYRGQRDTDHRGPRNSEYRMQRDTEYRGQRDNEYRSHRDDYRGQRDTEYRGQRDTEYRGQRDVDFRINREGHQDLRAQDMRRDAQQLHRGGQGQGIRGGWVNRGGRGGAGPGMRGRGRGGAPGTFNRAPGSGPQNQQQTNANANKKNTLKFDEEYDFDKANSEFEELRSKTAKLKIADGEEEKPKLNGEDKKDDSGNETGLGEGEHEEDPDHDKVIYYDKAKSFFDNISCEAVERSKGRSQRTDWRTERKLNSETFGVASARRGGYRGRGGYYGGRGMYRGYRSYNMRGQGNRNNITQPKPTHSQQPAVASASAK